MGNFESQMNWERCASVNEPWASSDLFNTKWLKPQGERSSQNEGRWSGEKADQYSALIDEMGVLPLGDPKVEELFIEASKIFFEELPIIPVTQAKKIIPFDTTYWTGWPTFENDYIHPPTWWQSHPRHHPQSGADRRPVGPLDEVDDRTVTERVLRLDNHMDAESLPSQRPCSDSLISVPCIIV